MYSWKNRGLFASPPLGPSYECTLLLSFLVDAPRSLALATSSMGWDPAVDRQYCENANRSMTRGPQLYRDTHWDAKLSSDLRGDQFSERMVEFVDANRREHDRGRYLVAKDGRYSIGQRRGSGYMRDALVRSRTFVSTSVRGMMRHL